METQILPHFDRIIEQAAHIVEDFSDEIIENESFRAWERAVYPMLYTTFALYSCAASALINSAGDMMQARH